MKGFLLKTGPTLEDSCRVLSEGLEKKRFILVVGRCKVDYAGRSSSKLGFGERVIMVKPDATVLIHRRSGHEAVNWQPPEGRVSVNRSDDGLVLRALRKRPKEMLDTTFSDIYLIALMNLADTAPFEMLLSERELYNVIAQNPDLIEVGLRVLSRQKEFKRGLADFTAKDLQGNYVVIEVKRDAADTEAVTQLYKYVSDIRKTSGKVRGVIAAPQLRPSAERLAKSLNLEFRRLDLEKCSRLLAAKRVTELESLDGHLT